MVPHLELIEEGRGRAASNLRAPGPVPPRYQWGIVAVWVGAVAFSLALWAAAALIIWTAAS